MEVVIHNILSKRELLVRYFTSGNDMIFISMVN